MTILWQSSASIRAVTTSAPFSQTILTVPPGVGFFDPFGFHTPDGIVMIACALTGFPGNCSAGFTGTASIDLVDNTGTVQNSLPTPLQVFSTGGFTPFFATPSVWGPLGGTVRLSIFSLGVDTREVFNGAIAMFLTDDEVVVGGEIGGSLQAPDGTGEQSSGTLNVTGTVTRHMDFRQWVRTVHAAQILTPRHAYGASAGLNLNGDSTATDFSAAPNWVNVEHVARYDTPSGAGSADKSQLVRFIDFVLVPPGGFPVGATSIRVTVHTTCTSDSIQMTGQPVLYDAGGTPVVFGPNTQANSSNGFNDTTSWDLASYNGTAAGLGTGAQLVLSCSRLATSVGTGTHHVEWRFWSNDDSFYAYSVGVAQYTGVMPSVPPALVTANITFPVTSTTRGAFEFDTYQTVVAALGKAAGFGTVIG